MSQTRQDKPVHVPSVAQLPQLTPGLYREIFMNSREAISIISPQGHYIEQNGAHFQLLGYSDAELEGKTPSIHMGDEAFARVVEELVANGSFQGEIISRTKDDRELHLDLSAFTMRSSVGEPLCYIGIKRDITARKRSEEAVSRLLSSEQSARSDAEKANRLKDEFLATLSHELRTPLNAVIGWSRMLRMGRLDAASSNHALEVIERNAWAQQQIIEDILDVSRVITGKLRLNIGPVRVDSVVDAAVDAMRPALQAKEIRIETSVPDNLNLVLGDSDRLRQVIWNLLSNAAKFTPHRGEVGIAVSHEGSRLNISVEDSGPGIDPQFLPHVFERFRQADGSTTRTHGGLGLGLAIVRHLVELHGGTIGAENRSNGSSGAIFTVTLPMPSVEMTAEILKEGFVPKEHDHGDVQLDGVHILAVDDELDALDLITIELTEHGASVCAVRSAEEALSELKGEKFDVLIADIGMPDIDGYELMKRIRQTEIGTGKRIPAVALTAYARVEDRMRAVVSGYNTHVAKPIEIHELLTVVASLAGRYDKH
jgi:PAS domain S-box-containing protein